VLLHDHRLAARYPGDGRLIAPGRGWVDVDHVSPADEPTADELPRAYPMVAEPDILRLRVPYQSQLDGTLWAGANCGPTTLGMALESFGIEVSTAELRARTLDTQQMWGDEAGTLLDALARVAQSYGVRTPGLFAGSRLRRWTIPDIREHVQAGHPVIVQVRYRALPGREDFPYFGDHYIVITGLAGDDFLYNDSIDSDGVGYDRIMPGQQLWRAMNTSDRRYTYAAFAVDGG
jgi:hypothetical protein